MTAAPMTPLDDALAAVQRTMPARNTAERKARLLEAIKIVEGRATRLQEDVLYALDSHEGSSRRKFILPSSQRFVAFMAAEDLETIGLIEELEALFEFC